MRFNSQRTRVANGLLSTQTDVRQPDAEGQFNADQIPTRCMPCRMRIDLTCAECHKNSFNLGHGTDDDSVIRCTSCGHRIGTMAELKERVAAEVLKHAANKGSPSQGSR